jgi:hypothetical protein
MLQARPISSAEFRPSFSKSWSIVARLAEEN